MSVFVILFIIHLINGTHNGLSFIDISVQSSSFVTCQFSPKFSPSVSIYLISCILGPDSLKPAPLEYSYADEFYNIHHSSTLSFIYKTSDMQILHNYDIISIERNNNIQNTNMTLKLWTPKPNEPKEVMSIYLCPKDNIISQISSSSTLYGCRSYEIHVASDWDVADLSDLSVANGEIPASFSPRFSPNVTDYTLDLTEGYDATIFAVAAKNGRVSLTSEHRGLPHSLSIAIPAEKLQEKDVIKVYTFSQFYTYSKVYSIHITSHRNHIVRLTELRLSLNGNKLLLSPPFDPSISQYFVKLPIESFHPGQTGSNSLNVHAMAEDVNAHVYFSRSDFHQLGEESKNTQNIESYGHLLREDLPIPNGPPFFITLGISTMAHNMRNRGTIQIAIDKRASHVAVLSNISTPDCVLDPPFDPHHDGPYRCVFWYETARTVRLTPIISEHCPECVLMAPSNTLPFHLRANFEDTQKVPWTSGRTWFRKLLYGEYHMIPFRVFAEDQVHYRTYQVYVERACPWYMNVRFTRAVSQASSTIAIVMSVTNAGNVMALAKQLQFMSLTSHITGIPDIYVDYTKNLDKFSLQIDILPKSWGEMSPKAIRKYFKKYIAIKLAKMEACFDLLGKQFAVPDIHMNFNVSYVIVRKPMSYIAEIDTLPNKKLLQRLSRPDGSFTVYLPDKQDDLVTYCSHGKRNLINAVEDFIALKQFIHLLSSNLVFQFGAIVILSLCYWCIYDVWRRRRQVRYPAFEPYPAWTFALDFGLIGFCTSVIGTLFSSHHHLNIFGYKPTHFEIQSLCVIGLIGYPVFYLIFIYLKLKTVENKQKITYNEKMQRFVDTRVDSISVDVGAVWPISMIPAVNNLLSRSVTAAIPIKNEEGEQMTFDESTKIYEEKAKNYQLSPAPSEENKTTTSSLKFHPNEKPGTFKAPLWLDKSRDGSAHGDYLIQLSEPIVYGWRIKDRLITDVLEEEELFAMSCWFRTITMNIKSLEELDIIKLEIKDGCFNIIDSDGIGSEEKNITSINNEDIDLNKLHFTKERHFASLRSSLTKRGSRLALSRLKSKDEKMRRSQTGDDQQRLEEEEKIYPFFEDLDRKRLVWRNSVVQWEEPGDIFQEDKEEKNHSIFDKISIFLSKIFCRKRRENYVPINSNKYGVFYADKYHLITNIFPDRPWHEDDVEDTRKGIWKYLGFIDVFSGLFKKPPNVMDRNFSNKEVKEIKKWLYYELLPLYLIQVQIAWYICLYENEIALKSTGQVKHKFFSLNELFGPGGRWANFDDLVDELLEEGVFEKKKNVHRQESASEVLSIATPTSTRKNKGNGSTRYLKIKMKDYVCQHIESLYATGSEPWWKGVDAPGLGEYRIMLDDQRFFKPLSVQDQKKFPFLAKTEGFYRSDAFGSYPDAKVGTKKYTLYRPDKNNVSVSVDICLRHILPIMSYIPRFKLTVPEEALGVEEQRNLSIILVQARRSSLYFYVLDRASTLMAIALITCSRGSNPIGYFQIFGFMLIKLALFLFDVNVNFKEHEIAKSKFKTQVESIRARRDHQLLDEGTNSLSLVVAPSSGLNAHVVYPGTTIHTKESAQSRLTDDGLVLPEEQSTVKVFAKSAFEVAVSGDAYILLLQTLTLFTLFVGHQELQVIPGPVAAVLAIIFTSCTMLFMNLFSFTEQLRVFFDNLGKNITLVKNTLVYYKYKVYNTLAKMPLLEHFITLDVQALTSIDDSRIVDFVVPEYGIVMSGEIEFDPGMSLLERVKASLSKRMYVYTLDRHQLPDLSVRSARHLSRYEQDVKTGMTVVLTPNQFQLKEKLSNLAAIIQVINHSSIYELCSPKFDSFLSLFYPPAWDSARDSKNEDKLKRLLKSWVKQVDVFLSATVGAMDTKLTATADVRTKLDDLLREQAEWKQQWKAVRVRLKGAYNLPTQKYEVGAQELVACVLLESTENPTDPSHYEHVVRRRKSQTKDSYTKTIKQEKNTSLQSPLISSPKESMNESVHVDWEEEMFFLVPSHEQNLIISVWEQDNISREFVGYTHPISISSNEEDLPGATTEKDYLSVVSSKAKTNDDHCIQYNEDNIWEFDDYYNHSLYSHISKTGKPLGFKKGIPKTRLVGNISFNIETVVELIDENPFTRDEEKDELEEELAKLEDSEEKQQYDVGNKILHFVLVSEHLKPNRNWKPDPIPPHVGKIILPVLNTSFAGGISKAVIDEVHSHLLFGGLGVGDKEDIDVPIESSSSSATGEGESPSSSISDEVASSLNRFFEDTSKGEIINTISDSNLSLISISTTQFSIKWKDLAIERLSPLRSFILENWATYEDFWGEGIKYLISMNQGDLLTSELNIFQFKSIILHLCDDYLRSANKGLLNTHEKYRELMESKLQSRSRSIFNSPRSNSTNVLQGNILVRQMSNFMSEIGVGDTSTRDDEDILLKSDFDEDFVLLSEDEIFDQHLDFLFKTLDPNNDKSIAIEELKPVTGDTLDAVDQSLLEYDIPMTMVSKFSVYQNSFLILYINLRFINSPEWRDLKKAIDPNWCLDDDVLNLINEYYDMGGDDPPIIDDYYQTVTIQLRSQFINMWEKIIDSSNLRHVQMVIENYDGQVIDHPRVKGVYMRHGRGRQWYPQDKIMYDGDYKNHVYDGSGILRKSGKVMFDGDWRRGLRHGECSQFTLDIGEFNIYYYGNVFYDHFKGEGSLIILKSTMDVVSEHPTSTGMLSSVFSKLTGKSEERNRVSFSIAESSELFRHWRFSIQTNVNFIRYLCGEFNGPGVKTEDLLDFTKIDQYYSDDTDDSHNLNEKTADFITYFDANKLGVQQAGPILTDYSSEEYFGSIRNSANHFSKGNVIWAFDSMGSMALFDSEMYKSLKRDESFFLKKVVKSGFKPTGVPFAIGHNISLHNGVPHGKMENGGYFRMFYNSLDGPVVFDEYIGDFKDGYRHGYPCKLSLMNGTVYYGEFDNNLMQTSVGNSSKLILPTEIAKCFGYTEYTGGFFNDYRHGKCSKWILTDGSYYVGDVGVNLRHGTGELYSEKDQLIYKGEWNKDERTSPCVFMRLENQMIYSGEYDYLYRPHGRGKLFKNEAHFNAHFQSHSQKEPSSPPPVQKSTKSKMKLTNVNDSPPPIYEGTFIKGKFSGKGKLYCFLGMEELLSTDSSTSSLRKSSSNVGMPSYGSKYTLLWSFEGNFKLGVRHGEGKMSVYNEGKEYTGTFRRNNRSGQGELRQDKNGYIYRGEWAKDKPHGTGHYEDAEYAHDNVLFAEGVCQMPFVIEGPPRPGARIGNVFGGGGDKDKFNQFIKLPNPDKISSILSDVHPVCMGSGIMRENEHYLLYELNIENTLNDIYHYQSFDDIQGKIKRSRSSITQFTTSFDMPSSGAFSDDEEMSARPSLLIEKGGKIGFSINIFKMYLTFLVIISTIFTTNISIKIIDPHNLCVFYPDFDENFADYFTMCRITPEIAFVNTTSEVLIRKDYHKYSQIQVIYDDNKYYLDHNLNILNRTEIGNSTIYTLQTYLPTPDAEPPTQVEINYCMRLSYIRELDISIFSSQKCIQYLIKFNSEWDIPELASTLFIHPENPTDEIIMTPRWSPLIFHYTVRIIRDRKLKYSASANHHSRISIGESASTSGLPSYISNILEPNPQNFNIKVFSNTLKYSKMYYFTFIPTLSTDATLKDISTGSSLLNVFKDLPFENSTFLKVPVDYGYNNDIHITPIVNNKLARVYWSDDGLHDRKSIFLEHGKSFKLDNPVLGATGHWWFRSVSIEVFAENLNYTKVYQVFFIRQGGKYSKLSHLSLGGHHVCEFESDIEFHPDKLKYKCILHYDKTQQAMISPVVDLDGKCKDCKIYMPDNQGEKHLRANFMKMIKYPWKNSVMWYRKLLFGEYHDIPVKIYAQDGFHSHEYIIYVECRSPWYLKAIVTQWISFIASLFAAFMSIASSVKLLALTKLIQFMTLTSRISGTPQTFIDFTHTLDKFSLKFHFLPKSMGQLGEQAEMKLFATPANLQLYATVLACHDLLGDKFSVPALPFHIRIKYKIIRTNNVIYTDRRLSEEEITSESHRYLREETGRYPVFDIPETYTVKLPHGHAALVSYCTENALYIMGAVNDYEDIKEFMHSTASNVILQGAILITLLLIYFGIYEKFRPNLQVRPTSFEPIPLWMVLLDFGLIGFTTAITSLCFSKHAGAIVIAGISPGRAMIVFGCIVFIISYPFAYLIYVNAQLTKLIRDEQALVFNDELKYYIDRTCDTVNVPVEPRVPLWIPGLHQMTHRTIHSAIPILNEDGDVLCFDKYEQGETILENQSSDHAPLLSICQKLSQSKNIDNVQDEYFKDCKYRNTNTMELEKEEVVVLLNWINEKCKLQSTLSSFNIFKQDGENFTRITQAENWLDYIPMNKDTGFVLIMNTNTGEMRWANQNNLYKYLQESILSSIENQEYQKSLSTTTTRRHSTLRDVNPLSYANPYQYLIATHFQRPWKREWDLDYDLRYVTYDFIYKLCKRYNILFKIYKYYKFKKNDPNTFCPRIVSLKEQDEIANWILEQLKDVYAFELKLMVYWKCANYHYKTEYNGEYTMQNFMKLYESSGLNREIKFVLSCLETGSPTGNEPWWQCSADVAKKNEVKVMLDEDRFFNELSIEDYHLYPYLNHQRNAFFRGSFATSTIFRRFPDAFVGNKRLGIELTSGETKNVESNVNISHIQPLFSFFDRFKLNVAISNLSLKHRQNLRISLLTAKKVNYSFYVTDRTITMIQIFIITSSHKNDDVAVYQYYFFFLLKCAVFYLLVRDNIDEEALNRGLGKLSWSQLSTEEKKKLLLKGDGFVFLMQIIILSILIIGLRKSIYYLIPGGMTAIFAVFVCSYTMIVMNIEFFMKQMNNIIDELRESTSLFKNNIHYYKHQLDKVLRKIPCFEYFVTLQLEEKLLSVQKCNVYVSDYGMFFEGNTIRSFGKTSVESAIPTKIHTFTLPYKLFTKYQYRSVRDLKRFEENIRSSLTLPLSSTEFEGKISMKNNRLALIIQVVNHCMLANLSTPLKDDFYALFYPQWWKHEEHFFSEEAIFKVIESWEREYNVFFTERIGADFTKASAASLVIKDLKNLMVDRLCVHLPQRKVKVFIKGAYELPTQLSEIGALDLFALVGRSAIEDSTDSIHRFHIGSERSTSVVDSFRSSKKMAHEVKDKVVENATWEECLEFVVSRHEESLFISVWDEDIASSDFIGFTKPITIPEESNKSQRVVDWTNNDEFEQIDLFIIEEDDEDVVYEKVGYILVKIETVFESAEEVEAKQLEVSPCPSPEELVTVSSIETESSGGLRNVFSKVRQNVEERARSELMSKSALSTLSDAAENRYIASMMTSKGNDVITNNLSKITPEDLQVTHFVVLSEHLKRSPNWAPDFIPPMPVDVMVTPPNFVQVDTESVMPNVKKSSLKSRWSRMRMTAQSLSKVTDKIFTFVNFIRAQIYGLFQHIIWISIRLYRSVRHYLRRNLFAYHVRHVEGNIYAYGREVQYDVMAEAIDEHFADKHKFDDDDRINVFSRQTYVSINASYLRVFWRNIDREKLVDFKELIIKNDGSLHVFWTKFFSSISREIQYDEFYNSLCSNSEYLEYFQNVKDSNVDYEIHRIFDLIDVNKNGDISYEEFVDHVEIIDNINNSSVLLSDFKIPLSDLYRFELFPESLVIAIFVNPRAMSTKEWIQLKKSLDPEWSLEQHLTQQVSSALNVGSDRFKVDPYYNCLFIRLLDSDQFDFWDRVVSYSNMRNPPMVIVNYVGEVIDHPNAPGTRVRHGQGRQVYTDSHMVYDGEWKYHVYDGYGVLKVRDSNEVIYAGSFWRGVKRGQGVFGPFTNGVSKKCFYEGSFYLNHFGIEPHKDKKMIIGKAYSSDEIEEKTGHLHSILKDYSIFRILDANISLRHLNTDPLCDGYFYSYISPSIKEHHSQFNDRGIGPNCIYHISYIYSRLLPQLSPFHLFYIEGHWNGPGVHQETIVDIRSINVYMDGSDTIRSLEFLKYFEELPSAMQICGAYPRDITTEEYSVKSPNSIYNHLGYAHLAAYYPLDAELFKDMTSSNLLDSWVRNNLKNKDNRKSTIVPLYTGDYQNGLPHGKGKLLLSLKLFLQLFRQYILSPIGEAVFKNDEIVSNILINSFGSFYKKSGDQPDSVSNDDKIIYSGDFQNGLFHGDSGNLYINDVLLYSGPWLMGIRQPPYRGLYIKCMALSMTSTSKSLKGLSGVSFMASKIFSDSNTNEDSYSERDSGTEQNLKDPADAIIQDYFNNQFNSVLYYSGHVDGKGRPHGHGSLYLDIDFLEKKKTPPTSPTKSTVDEESIESPEARGFSFTHDKSHTMAMTKQILEKSKTSKTQLFADMETFSNFIDGHKFPLYSGEFEYGKFSGRGILITPFWRYMGEFKNGRRHGQGRFDLYETLFSIHTKEEEFANLFNNTNPLSNWFMREINKRPYSSLRMVNRSYVGSWENGRRQGEGVLRMHYGDIIDLSNNEFNLHPNLKNIVRIDYIYGKKDRPDDVVVDDKQKVRLPVYIYSGEWFRNLAHGVGSFEDDQAIHEGLLFNQGSCEMPFMHEGLPKIEFGTTRRTRVLHGKSKFLDFMKLRDEHVSKIRTGPPIYSTYDEVMDATVRRILTDDSEIRENLIHADIIRKNYTNVSAKDQIVDDNDGSIYYYSF